MSIKNAGTTAKNSMSLSRAPGPPDEITTGSTTNYPFWPGGFDMPELPSDFDITDAARECLDDIENSSKHLTCPPGFDHGMTFDLDNDKPHLPQDMPEKDIINLASLITSTSMIGEDLGIWKANSKNGKEDKMSNENGTKEFDQDSEVGLEGTNENLDALVSTLDNNSTILPISDSGTTNKKGVTKTEWAEMIDISQPVIDFHQQVPQMAFTWPFELDTFQKQAVIRLEESDTQLKQAQLVIESIKTDAEATAKVVKSGILTDGKNEIERLTASAKAQIGTIEAKVRKQISDYVATLALQRVTLQLEGNIGSNLQQQIIDTNISKLGG